MLAEKMANLSYRPVTIIGSAVNQHGHASMSIPLITHLFVRHSLKFSSTPLDRAVNSISSHVPSERFFHRSPQPGIGCAITSTRASSHGDLSDQLGKQLATLGVLGRLAKLDIGPFAVSGHLGRLFLGLIA